MLNKTRLLLETKDQVQIALWKVTGENGVSDKHIFLTHGTFSNRKVCLGMASFLVEKGFTCWILEWRNHGDSPAVNTPFNFETIALYDFLAVFEYLFQRLKIPSLDCITHSGGGLCLTMFLINYPDYHDKVKSISLFCCQSFGAAITWKSYLRLLLGKYLTALVGYIPGRKLKLGEHNESYYTMKQWFNWNLSQQFVGANGMDYLAQMPTIEIPILSICGKGDTFIAPLEGCRRFLAGFQKPKNKLLICSKENGHLEDYNHSRILHSCHAKKEIWPEVLAWMESAEEGIR
jgi:pimeloyl-ACP methyl ester carboxylesterase